MPTRINNIKPQYSEKNETVFSSKTGKIDVKKEISDLAKIIDESKKLKEKYLKNKSNSYAY